MSKMKIKLEKTLAVLSSCFIVTTTSGCVKKNEDNQIGYVVETINNEQDTYCYILNHDGFDNPNYIHTEHVGLANIESTEKHTNKFEKTTAWMRNNLLLIKPDKLAICDVNWLGNDSFDCSIKTETVREFNGGKYKIVYSSATAKKDMYKTGCIPVKKGDKLESTAIFFEGNLFTFNQTGAGSICKNIQNAQVGDIDKALKTVQSEFNINESTKVTEEELKDIQKSINYPNNKVLIKK